MSDNGSDSDITPKVPTRREWVKYGGAVIGGGLLAGCTGSGDTGGGGANNSNNSGGRANSSSDSGESSGADSSYEACIKPVGCQTFESVPETWMAKNGGWADMAFALGQRDGFLTASSMIPGFFFEPFGLDVPPAEELPVMYNEGYDKEVFYELDPDVFLIDPNILESADNWNESDTQEMMQNVAPFFGNNARRRREFHDYKLYTLYGCFEKCAELFEQRERYEAIVEVHDDLQQTIKSRLPDSQGLPIGLINGGSNPAKGEFYPLDPRSEGYEMKPYRDLNVQNAFDVGGEGELDYEGLLEVDPDVILVHWGIGNVAQSQLDGSFEGVEGFDAEAFREFYVKPMEEHPVGSELTAVQEGNVYPGQYGEQGSLTNLIQTEMVAQQLYPDEFGEFAPKEFPDVPEEQRLFDRQRVTDIINGEI